jgi:hypothetical protein
MFHVKHSLKILKVVAGGETQQGLATTISFRSVLFHVKHTTTHDCANLDAAIS